MKNKILVLMFFYVTTLHASSFKVLSPSYKFEIIKVTENHFQLLANSVNISLKRSVCNERVFKDFSETFEYLMNYIFQNKKQQALFLRVYQNEKINFVHNQSYIAKLLMSIPKEFKRLKYQSYLLCTKDES